MTRCWPTFTVPVCEVLPSMRWVFGSHPETDYLHECEKYWDMY